MKNPVHVAVAVIRNNSGDVFITQRPEHVHQGGLWEFPGGKIEPGESVPEALRREIEEETGISIQSAGPLIKIPFRYPDKQVLLDVWEVQKYSGDPHGKEGQTCKWIDSDTFGNFSFPAANRSIISAVRLPSVYLVTPEPGADKELFLKSLERNIVNGIRGLLFRAKSLSELDYNKLAKEVCQLGTANGATVMLYSERETVETLGAGGIHVTSQQLMALRERPLGFEKWFSASCHTQKEIEHANSIGVDFILVGSVKATPSHQDTKPIGWQAFSRLTSLAAMPVYAIGGMTADDQKQSREMGGQGIAAISALWK